MKKIIRYILCKFGVVKPQPSLIWRNILNNEHIGVIGYGYCRKDLIKAEDKWRR
jgi:hypothetical protein